VSFRLFLLGGVLAIGCRWDFDRPGADDGDAEPPMGRDATTGAADSPWTVVGDAITVTSVIVVESGVADAEIREQMPDQGYGSGIVLTADGDPLQRILIQFDLVTVMAAGATVDEAVLELYVANDNPVASVKVQPVLEEWRETEVTWAERTRGVPWTAPGGTLGWELATVLPVGHEIVATDVVELVRAWNEGTYANHGVALVIEGATSQLNVAARENGGFPGPRLIVTVR
jgi:hypothetical protein